MPAQATGLPSAIEHQQQWHHGVLPVQGGGVPFANAHQQPAPSCWEVKTEPTHGDGLQLATAPQQQLAPAS